MKKELKKKQQLNKKELIGLSESLHKLEEEVINLKEKLKQTPEDKALRSALEEWKKRVEELEIKIEELKETQKPKVEQKAEQSQEDKETEEHKEEKQDEKAEDDSIFL